MPNRDNERLGIFSRRAAAYFVDCVIVFCLFVLTQISLFKLLRDAFQWNTAWFKIGWHTELYTLATISLPAWLYFALFDSSRMQGTPGKLLMRLELTRRGARLSFSIAILRTVLKLLPWEFAHLANNLPVPLWYSATPGFRVGFLISTVVLVAYAVSILVDKNARSIYDRILNTRVSVRG